MRLNFLSKFQLDNKVKIPHIPLSPVLKMVCKMQNNSNLQNFYKIQVLARMK